MSKAVVFGGGGSVGTAWQTGLNAGWNRLGVDLTDADLIVGTSAGAAVGVQVALGHDLDAQLERYESARKRAASGKATRVLNLDSEQSKVLRALFDRGNASGFTDKSVREEICRVATTAETMSEEDFLLTVKYLKGETWPPNYVCTTVNVETAEFEPLHAGLGGDLDRGVAAAVAVPGFYPPITVAGQRYVDGGCLSPTHLDQAASHDRILFIQMTETPQRELDAVAGAELLVIRPDAESRASFGDNLMNASAAFGAAETGLAQGLRTAAEVKAFWQA
ncbi:MAG TPA: patatin-like phospholipase family protein [Amycolatopsis sp.]|nr:patatin-like phospholipase family protein [Amycolatopsis sp.]